MSELNNEISSDVEKLKNKMKNDNSVEDNLVALIQKLVKKSLLVKPNNFKCLSINYQYLHTVVKDNLAKLMVVVAIETKENSEAVKTFGKQLSMHIAASNPLALELT